METAREHFVARLTEGEDACAVRAVAYLDAALSHGTGLTGRRPRRSIARR